MEVAILAGGMGTRLRPLVADRPKPMGEVAGRPFLEWILLALRAQGVRRVVLCTGHLGEMLEARWGRGSGLGLELAYSREEKPLGTAGALRLALPLLRGPLVAALNGDSWCRFSLATLAGRHRALLARATLWLARVEDAGRYGAVSLAADGRVTAFAEKAAGGGPGLVNAGVYLLDRSLLESLPAGAPVSLEREVFPPLVGKGLCGVAGNGPFLDIGTPESFLQAGAALEGELAALRAREGETP